MKNQGVFRVILVIGLLADLGVLGFLASDKPTPMTVDSWEQFRSEAGSFSVKYPAGWKDVEYTRPTDVEAKFTTANDTMFSAMVSLKGALVTDLIKFNPTSKESPLKVCHEMLVDDLAARHARFKEAATTPIKIGKTNALSTTYDYKIVDGLRTRSMKGSVVSIWNGKDHMALRLTCPADRFEDMLPVFSTFMKTFSSKAPEVESPGGGEIPLPMPF